MNIKNNKTPDFARMTLPLIPRNRSGWIEIVEAFVAILLISGVLLVLFTQQNSEGTDMSTSIYTTQISILREIQTNDNFRNEILSPVDTALPIEWESPNFPPDIKAKIVERTPNYLECKAKICSLDNECILSPSPKGNVYAQEVIISFTLTQEGYRRFKLFCWNK